MEFLFVGCSMTWGDELEDRFNSRYSKIVSDALGANETNIAQCGQSNDWIARRTVEETRKKRYDRVYVQLTVPSRLEYFTEDGSYKFSHQMVKQKEKAYYIQGRWYYKTVWNKQLGIENMYKNKFIIENALDFRTQLVFLSADCCPEGKKKNRHLHDNSYWNRLCKVDNIWIWKDILGPYPTTIDMMGERGHPLEPAHLKIANYLISHGK